MYVYLEGMPGTSSLLPRKPARHEGGRDTDRASVARPPANPKESSALRKTLVYRPLLYRFPPVYSRCIWSSVIRRRHQTRPFVDVSWSSSFFYKCRRVWEIKTSWSFFLKKILEEITSVCQRYRSTLYDDIIIYEIFIQLFSWRFRWFS